MIAAGDPFVCEPSKDQIGIGSSLVNSTHPIPPFLRPNPIIGQFLLDSWGARDNPNTDEGKLP